MVLNEVRLPRISTLLPGPRAQAILARDRRVISPSYTRVYPLVVQRGQDCLLEDVDGNLFLDFNAGIAVAATGHAHPQVVAAIAKQAGEFLHMSGTDFYYEHMPAVAERLAATMPASHDWRVYFGNSGTEAMEASIKLARYHTRRDKFIAFLGSFHGRTMGALSLTASKPAQRARFGSLVPGVHHVPYPDEYRGHSVEQAFQAIDRLFHTILPPDEVAAIVVEPIQGEGGYLIPPPAFLQGLRRICDEHGIMLVCDEVQSGIGRTGKMWAFEHSGIVPDIVASAKGLASGMPLGAAIARAEVMDWKPGAHASTFGGNPVCLAAALATLDLVEGGLMENAVETGAYIMRRISDWPSKHGLVGSVRGVGLMVGIELVKDKSTREPAHDEREALVEKAFHKGLLLLGCGASTLRLMPPLTVGVDQAEFALDVIEDLLGRL